MSFMRRLVLKLYLEKYSVMQWHTQAGNSTTNIKGIVDFTFFSLSTTHVVTYKWNVDDSANGRYDMNLGKYLSTDLNLNMKFSDHTIK